MMNQFDSIPLRLAITASSNAPMPPLDFSTQEPPTFWTASSLVIQVGIFDALGVSVDLSNLAALTCSVFRCKDCMDPLFEKAVQSSEIVPYVNRCGWTSQQDQNASFEFTDDETDIELVGEDRANLWMVIWGVTNGGRKLIYSAGRLVAFNSGTGSKYLASDNT